MNHPSTREALPCSDAERKAMFKRIAAECGEAWLALKEGRSHPRANNKTIEQRKAELRTWRNAQEAAFYPKLPKILVTTYQEPVEWYGDYTDRIHGAGGAEKQE